MWGKISSLFRACTWKRSQMDMHPNAWLLGDGGLLVVFHIIHKGCKPEGWPWVGRDL